LTNGNDGQATLDLSIWQSGSEEAPLRLQQSAPAMTKKEKDKTKQF